jgi:hypothetical protein
MPSNNPDISYIINLLGYLLEGLTSQQDCHPTAFQADELKFEKENKVK